MSDKQSILTKIEMAQICCLNLATGRNATYEDYENRRAELLSEPLLQPHLPEWIVRCRYGSQFWSLMKETSATYQGRRKFIWNEFAQLLDLVERRGIEPTSLSLDEILQNCSSKNVAEAWSRCFHRREDDPEGAITSARSMLESVCKFILEEHGKNYSLKDDLPKLYKLTASVLNLSPSQHDEQIFKQILTGCVSVVCGLASLRNAFGDAHGKGTRQVKPNKRHAELAVNLSGTISAFLISTHEKDS